MGAVAALLLPMLPSIINGVGSLFKSKPKSGEDKMDTVLRMVQQIIAGMIQGKVPLPDGTTVDVQPDPQAVKGLIEGVLQQMKASGQLTEQPATGTLWILRGTVTPVQ